MPWFGKKTAPYPRLIDIYEFKDPDDPNWVEVLGSTIKLSNELLGGMASALSVMEVTEHTPEEELALRVECAAFALQATDRFAFVNGGQAFRDQLLAYLELILIAIVVDSYLGSRKTDLARIDAEDFVVGLFKATIDQHKQAAKHYYEFAEVVRTDTQYSQENSLTGMLQSRTRDQFSVPDHPTFHLASFQAVTAALIASDCLKAVKSAVPE